MKKCCLILFVICGWIAQASNTNNFTLANKLYEEEQYDSALTLYQQINLENVESTELYYNMGNAYYKTQQLASAILFYERALILSPYDEDIQQNLRIAQQATIDRFEKLPQPLLRSFYQGITTLLSPSIWAIIGYSFWGLVLIGLAVYLFGSKKRLGFGLALSSFLIGLIAVGLAYGHSSHLQQYRAAIVQAPSSYVKSGPSTNAEDVFILHEGTKAHITESYKEWQKIKLADGKVGWITAKDIEEI